MLAVSAGEGHRIDVPPGCTLENSELDILAHRRILIGFTRATFRRFKVDCEHRFDGVMFTFPNHSCRRNCDIFLL